MQQLDFAAKISALLGIPFPYGSIGRINPELYASGAGRWDMESSQELSESDIWRQSYANVLCVNSQQVFCQGEEELVVPVEPLNESHQIDEEQIKAKETATSENQMHLEIGEVHEARNLQAGMEWLQDDRSYQEECIIEKDKLEEHIEESNEENHNKGKLELQENVSIEDGKVRVIPQMSINIDVTPESRFQDASVAGPN